MSRREGLREEGLKEKGLEVVKAGAFTIVQDSGRRGGQFMGVCESGAADAYSYYWANTLLGNKPSAAVLEICLGGFQGLFHSHTYFALCGADMAAQLNGRKIDNWRSYRVSPGDYLSLHRARSGLRCYLSVSGGFLLGERVFTSFASVPREALGFNGGQAIAAGMVLPYKNNPSRGEGQKSLLAKYIPSYTAPLTLGVYPSYQFSEFDPRAKRQFTEGVYTISPQSNRMGYRLQGPPVLYLGKKIVSEGIALGAVQIPADGQPIVLLNDRQTIGGYPKMGCITRQACSALAQRRPGEKVQFKWQRFDN